MQTNFTLSWPIYWIRGFESKVLKITEKQLIKFIDIREILITYFLHKKAH